MALSTAGFWVCAWAVTFVSTLCVSELPMLIAITSLHSFTLPYLYNPESAGLGPMVGVS